MDTLQRNAPPKPARGEYALARKRTKLDRKAHEDREMRAARARDMDIAKGCRRPRCPHKGIALEVAHRVHRSMGGNPKGDRTTRQSCILLCQIHHGAYDRGDLDIRPLDESREFDGACDWWERNEAGDLEIVATERTIGISVERGA